MQIPDVCGYKMKNAEELLKRQGFRDYIVVLTAPPRQRNRGYDGESRVVRQTVSTDGTLQLIVCNVSCD